MRSARDYDHAHLTKVSSKGAQRVCGSRFAHNAHFDRAQGVEAFLARCEREVPSKTTGVVVCDACGSEAAEAAAALRGAGWEVRGQHAATSARGSPARSVCRLSLTHALSMHLGS